MPTHRLPSCGVPPQVGNEFCFAYNCCGFCKIQDTCTRQHKCIRCRGSHASIMCPENIVTMFKYSRKSASGSSMAIEHRSNTQSNYHSHSGIHSHSHEGAYHRQSNGGSPILSVKERLGGRVSDHYDYDDRPSKRRRDDYFENSHSRVSSGGDRYNSPSSSSSSPKLTLLQSVDKRNICRDYNNGKCGLEKCKYKHVCLMCGSYDHRERKCPLNPIKYGSYD
jgi:hypothetical protein